MEVASKRIVKADELSRVGDLLEAREWYEAAYQKVKGHWGETRANVIVAESLTKLTRVSMELQDDDAARHWIDSILDIYDNYSDICLYTMDLDLYYADEACYTAHYSKGLMLQRQGKITAAIRNFEAALMCNRGCHATYYQLEHLRRQETDEDIKRYEEGFYGTEWENMNHTTYHRRRYGFELGGWLWETSTSPYLGSHVASI